MIDINDDNSEASTYEAKLREEQKKEDENLDSYIKNVIKM